MKNLTSASKRLYRAARLIEAAESSAPSKRERWAKEAEREINKALKELQDERKRLPND